MSTRIGKYIFDIDLEHMDVEKLAVLKEACNHYINEKHREEIHSALTKINLLAHSYGFDICVYDADDYPRVMTEYSLVIKDRDEFGE